MENSFGEFSLSDPFETWWPFIIALIVGVITTIRGYFGGPHCPSEENITGKTVIITGGSSGIGLEVVAELAKRGGRVIVGSRDPETTTKTIHQKLMKPKKGIKAINVTVKHLDLTSLKSVRDFVGELGDEPKIDILINNAGIAFQDFHKTEEGFESHLITNYISHFLLTHLLIPKLRKAEKARIINVSAQAHYAGNIFLDDMNLENGYTCNKAFGQSKLAMVMMARHMEKIFKDTNITINAMHPGLVRSTRQFQKSPISSSFMMRVAITPWAWLLMKSPKQGAQTIIYMAVASELGHVSGKYFSNCKETQPSEKALDDSLGEKLYKKSLELTGISESDLCKLNNF